MQGLRRKDREISEEETLSILHNAEYGVLSMVSPDGMPYGVPLNFCMINDAIYFHCAVEGRKTDNLEKNSSVSFCAVGDTEVLPEKLSTRYQSAIVFGEAEEVFVDEKQMALEGLVRKYAPELVESGAEYIAKLTDKTRVFKIVISHMSGKARKN